MAEPQTLDALRGVGIFSGLEDEALERIARVAHEVTFEPRQVMIEAGAPGSGMFVLLEGLVSVHGHGFEAELGPGEVVGELALLRRDSRRIARVQAATPVRCLAIDRASFRELIESDGRLAVALLESVADRVPD